MKKAIQTIYKGYRFRSRLEARWAVYFDAMGLEWEYEPEGFELDDGSWYLPDFFLSDFSAWIEIKPKGGKRNEVFNQLRLMIEGGISEKNKAWGFFGDPLDHHWMLPIFRNEPLIIAGKVTQDKGWHEEWGNMSAFCVENFEGELRGLPTFSLTSLEKLKKVDSGFRKSDPSRLISNYAGKVRARSARFEHGECG